MKVQFEAEGRIENADVLNASAGYVIIARNGKVFKEYNPALAKAYRKKKQRGNKGQSLWPESLPEGFHAKKLNVQKKEVTRGSVSVRNAVKAHPTYSCKSCIWQVAQECVGEKTICEHYKFSPRDVTYYH